MNKRFIALTVLITILVIPSMLFAANKVTVGKTSVTDGIVTVPIVISNIDGLMAMDLPFKFSEGVVLKEVTYEDTRASYFDLKIADIDNENHTVAIGLITQITSTPKAELEVGEGTIANLVFEIVDENLEEILIETIITSKPDHRLMFIYQNRDDGQVTGQEVLYPEFEDITVILNSNVSELPTEYSLGQNYPNPFNPSTTITFALSQAGNYELNIYNVLGQSVWSVSDYHEVGEVSVQWDASSFASGVYFYKFSSGDFTDTKKMMLLK